MAERTCARCDSPLPPSVGPGRPRKYCDTCRRPTGSHSHYQKRDGLCVVEQCDEPIHAKRMCRAHYQAWYRKQNPDKFERYNAGRRNGPSLGERRVQTTSQTKQCEQCGETFTRSVQGSRRQWERKRFCGRSCQSKWLALNSKGAGRDFKPSIDHGDKVRRGRRASPKGQRVARRHKRKAQQRAAKIAARNARRQTQIWTHVCQDCGNPCHHGRCLA